VSGSTTIARIAANAVNAANAGNARIAETTGNAEP